ncbi:hypothetical protein TREES_T100019625 [Tupaia chinensis]|uniref:Uncharacterized protein n=1 Tax=Tupaia chinensis TaxID=246437 RepID=L9JY39_TUPCH|nr:hypothetical protein TREES_T100019625 [Tupaia chinensis]
MLTVVVEVEQGRGPGPEGTCNPTFLLEGPKNLRLLQPGTLEREVEGLVCRVLGPGAAQEAERELLACVQSTLGSVGQGYSVALLLRGRETEAPRLVPQLLQMLFEEALRLGCSGHVFSTLSLVQLSLNRSPRDLLSPEVKNLSALEVAPLGLVVEGASEVEVSNARSASAWYLQAAGAEDRACSLLTLTMSCPGPDPPEGPGTQTMWRGVLRILQLPEAPDCPLLQVLAGEAVGKEVEGSLPWIVSWLLEGNNYSGLLLRLDPQGSSLSLLQAALSGASGRRMQVKQVRPTLWNAVEEVQTRRAALRTLRLGLLGDTLTDCGLKQLSRALQELQVIKAWSQCPRYQTSKGARAETMGLPKSQVPDVALQFSLAQARRQRLREQHQIRIREELKHLEQEEEVVAGHQVKGLLAEEAFNKLSPKAYEEKQRWHREQTVLRLQLEALQAERDAAEQDLVALYDLHVQATRAQTCHMLQVFRAWQGLWEEKAMTTEHHHRSLLAGILQETINLATQNQELQAQNQQLQHGAD